MMPPGLLGILGLGFGLGMVHALDADHILAVSTLAARGRAGWVAWRFCVRWALGHGTALLVVGALVLLAGYHLPAQFSVVADRIAGLVMMALGGWVLFDLRRRNLSLRVHRHAGLPAHAHWHARDHALVGGHGATLVGALHGLAGSAPLLVLLPFAQSGAPWQGLLYLATFSVGVLFAMLAFGGALGGMLRWSDARGARWATQLRVLVAAAAVLLGLRMLWGAA